MSRWLSLDETRFIEVLVNILCPADALTPSGVDCGLAAYFIAQLDGAFGDGARRYLRGPAREGTPQHGGGGTLTPRAWFSAGRAALDAACVARHGHGFAALSADDANAVLLGLGDGSVASHEISLATWFDELVYPLFVQACFADPIHGGNKDAVFWKMIGYPGLPADYGEDFVRYRGRPYPGLVRTIEDETS